MYEFSRRKFVKMCKLRQVLVVLDEDAEELDQSAINRDAKTRKTLVDEKIISKVRYIIVLRIGFGLAYISSRFW